MGSGSSVQQKPPQKKSSGRKRNSTRRQSESLEENRRQRQESTGQNSSTRSVRRETNAVENPGKSRRQRQESIGQNSSTRSVRRETNTDENPGKNRQKREELIDQHSSNRSIRREPIIERQQSNRRSIPTNEQLPEVFPRKTHTSGSKTKSDNSLLARNGHEHSSSEFCSQCIHCQQNHQQKLPQIIGKRQPAWVLNKVDDNSHHRHIQMDDYDEETIQMKRVPHIDSNRFVHNYLPHVSTLESESTKKPWITYGHVAAGARLETNIRHVYTPYREPTKERRRR